MVVAKLFIVSPDGKSIFHSVTGRFLDFMVNVDVNGEKLTSESQGDAKSVSFSFGTDEITCAVATTVPSSFIYGTAKNAKIITLDYTRTLFGEPYPFVSADLTVGVVNQDSIINTLGDTTAVDFEGVKSFNAVANLQTEGRNSISLCS